MSMKKTDLEKKLALKLGSGVKNGANPARFAGATAPVDRREQRRRDQASGLVPFAVKIDSTLADTLRQLAAAGNEGINELVADLLRRGLADRERERRD